MSSGEVLAQLQSLGTDSYRRILKNHGAAEPVYGVKISDLKTILKQHRRDHDLACELYRSKVYDAQYLAGLMVDPSRLSKRAIQTWLKTANSVTLCGNIVAPVAAESEHGLELACEWIESPTADVAQTGWTTLAALVSIHADDDLDLALLKKLLLRAERTIHRQSDRVRYAMNNFVIALGCYVAPLTEAALAVAERIGRVECDMGETACQVPDAVEYIHKVQSRGAVGKKRKSALC